MYERKIPLSINCNLDLVSAVLYGKWKVPLLWFIYDGYKRPSELQRKIPHASRRVLTIQLKELEDHELISKVIYAVLPPKVEYSLTDLGKTLIPVIMTMGQWAGENKEQLQTAILRKFSDSISE